MTTTFQTTVQNTPALGVAGDKVDLNPFVYAPGNPLADGPVVIGTFVWASTKGAVNKTTSAIIPLGIVQREQAYFNYDASSGASMIVNDGGALSVIIKGDVYVNTLTEATRGQKVFAVLNDGTIKTGAAGSSIDGAIETEWFVDTGGAANSLIIISNWGPRVAAIESSKGA